MTDPTLPHGEPIPPVPKQPVLAYVVCLVIMSLIGAISFLAITLLRPDKDNTQLITTLLSMLTPTTGLLILLIHNSAAIKEVHYSLNSRLDQFTQMIKAAEFAKGLLAGREEAAPPHILPTAVPTGVFRPTLPNGDPALSTGPTGELIVQVPLPVPTVVLVPTQTAEEGTEQKPGGQPPQKRKDS